MRRCAIGTATTTIYLDFDGTIVDPSRRLYRLYSDEVRRLGHQPLAKEHYWTLKRQRLSERAILERTASAASIGEYLARRLDRIESPALLRHDTLLPEVEPALRRLARAYRLVLVSFRRVGANLHDQVAALGIAHHFGAVVPCYQPDIPGWRAKAMSIEADPLFDARRALMVGDTEDDVEAGHHLRLPTVAVLSGLRDHALLAALGPTVILESLAHLPSWLGPPAVAAEVSGASDEQEPRSDHGRSRGEPRSQPHHPVFQRGG
jgi:phosphoglycolate phosphatase-like HAD superfamily hydrolase